jgi:DNA-binding NtrC family response regulator
MKTTLEVHNPTVADFIDKELREHRGLDEIVTRFKNSVIVRALSLQEGDVSLAAILLKTDQSTLTRWMEEYRIAERYSVDDEN